MKAIVSTRYGPPDVLQLQDVAKPTPKDNEVLIRVHASTVTAGDCELRRFQIATLFWLPLRLYMGIRRPRGTLILGQELAGEIEAVGKDVTLFEVGDRAFAATGLKLGAHAEYKCLPEKGSLAKMPPTMTYAEAAAIPVGGLNALHFLRLANIQRGQQVLIYGSTGSIGTFAVQLARLYGAEVTAVCSTAKIELVMSLGATHVIDYTREDFTKNGLRYDVIFDTIGKSPFSGSMKSLKPDGLYLLANPGFADMARGFWASKRSGKTVITKFAGQRPDDLAHLAALAGAGTIRTVIDRSYPLEQMAEAHRYVEEGHKWGNVVISVGPDEPVHEPST